MWRYIQSSGVLFNPVGVHVATGYAGHWDGSMPHGCPSDYRNRSADQDKPQKGPLPKGKYIIEKAKLDPKLGPLTLHLIPDVGNQMFGRSLFRFHGDKSPPHSGQASEGCIIMPHDIRAMIDASTDRVLIVE